MIDPVDAPIVALLPTIYGWCARLGGPRVDAEEAAHDVLMLLVRRASDRGTGVSLRSFAWGVTRGVLANHRRRAWWRRWLPGPAEIVSDRTPFQDSVQRQLAGRVAALLARLTEEHREVLVLCDVEERPAPEVADILGIPEGTVRSRLRAARERFRALAPEFSLEPPGGQQ